VNISGDDGNGSGVPGAGGYVYYNVFLATLKAVYFCV